MYGNRIITIIQALGRKRNIWVSQLELIKNVNALVLFLYVRNLLLKRFLPSSLSEEQY